MRNSKRLLQKHNNVDNKDKIRNKTICLHNKDDVSKRAWAIAVDKFFHGFKDTKDEEFKTLSATEEKDLIEKYKDTRDILEYFLIKHNIFLALNLASRYSFYKNEYDSLLSSAMFGLTVAAKKFDISKNIKFSTYAVWWIKKYLYIEVNGDRYTKNITSNSTIHLDSYGLNNDENDNENFNYNTFLKSVEPSYMYNISYNTETPSNKIEKYEKSEYDSKLLDKISASINVSSLSDKDKQIYTKLFVDCENPDDVSKELNISKYTIAKSKLRIAAYISESFPKLKKQYNLK